MEPSELEQRSDEWAKYKLGKVSASNINRVLAKPKKRNQEESTTRGNYISQLAIEILTGKSAERQFTNYNLERGTQLEPRARAAYELQSSEMVLTAGFIDHPRIPRFGCSPDGMVGDKGLCQIKCPILRIHYEYFKLAKIEKVPTEYFAQMQCELACTGREWNDFCSYNEEYPPEHRIVVTRLFRDDPFIKDMEAAVIAFNQEVDEMVADLRGEKPSMEQQLRDSVKLVRG